MRRIPLKRHKRPGFKDQDIDVDELAHMANVGGMLSFLDRKPEEYARLFGTRPSAASLPQAPESTDNPLATASETGQPVSESQTFCKAEETQAIHVEIGWPVSKISPPDSKLDQAKTGQTEPESGQPITAQPDLGLTYARVRQHVPRPWTNVQDGLTLGEERVYRAIYTNGQPYGDGKARALVAGVHHLSSLAGLQLAMSSLTC